MGNNASREGSAAAAQDSAARSAARATLGPDGGHLVSVSGVYLEQDADLDVVAGLINARKLAPFYRGLDELPDEPTRDTIDAALYAVAQPRAADDDRRKAALALLPNRRTEPERHRRAEALAYLKHGTVDCTICFLVYPANVKCVRSRLPALTGQYDPMLRQPDLHRMLHTDQADRSHAHSPRRQSLLAPDRTEPSSRSPSPAHFASKPSLASHTIRRRLRSSAHRPDRECLRRLPIGRRSSVRRRRRRARVSLSTRLRRRPVGASRARRASPRS